MATMSGYVQVLRPSPLPPSLSLPFSSLPSPSPSPTSSLRLPTGVLPRDLLALSLDEAASLSLQQGQQPPSSPFFTPPAALRAAPPQHHLSPQGRIYSTPTPSTSSSFSAYPFAHFPPHATHINREAPDDRANPLGTHAAGEEEEERENLLARFPYPFIHGVGWSDDQGKRPEMEDEMTVLSHVDSLRDSWILGIYDGHGGKQTADLLSKRLHRNFLALLREKALLRWRTYQIQAQQREKQIQEHLLYIERQVEQAETLGDEREGGEEEEELPPAVVEVFVKSLRLQKILQWILRTPSPWYPEKSKKKSSMKKRQTSRSQRRGFFQGKPREEEEEDVLGRGRSYSNERLGQQRGPHYLSVCTPEDMEQAAKEAFIQTDYDLLERERIFQSGATACFCCYTPLLNLQRLVTMNPSELTDEDWGLFFPSHSSSGDPLLESSSLLSPPQDGEKKPRPDQEEGDKGQKTPNEKNKKKSQLLSMNLTVAHLGDSRAVLVFNDGKVLRLTSGTDHKASDPIETDRVEKLGGWVYGERVNGQLAIGRAFGDWNLKLNSEEFQMVSTLLSSRNDEEEEANFSSGRGGRSLLTTSFSVIRNLLAGASASSNDEDGDDPDEGKKRRESVDSQDEENKGGRLRSLSNRRKKSFLSSSPTCLDVWKQQQRDFVVSHVPHVYSLNLSNFFSSSPANTNSTEGGQQRDSSLNTSSIPLKGAGAPSPPLPSSSSSSPSCPVLLVLGCDGLFDVCPDEAVGEVSLQFLSLLCEEYRDMTPAEAASILARCLVDEAISHRGSTDNVSVQVALLSSFDFDTSPPPASPLSHERKEKKQMKRYGESTELEKNKPSPMLLQKNAPTFASLPPLHQVPFYANSSSPLPSTYPSPTSFASSIPSPSYLQRSPPVYGAESPYSTRGEEGERRGAATRGGGGEERERKDVKKFIPPLIMIPNEMYTQSCLNNTTPSYSPAASASCTPQVTARTPSKRQEREELEESYHERGIPMHHQQAFFTGNVHPYHPCQR
ncbi:protein phosphatase 2c domain-containing [Cystoisospora suis]|uniref:Protein phosphatase 2c domain-containing n=1 Tax=Cystoisospora suis TaxID=483139 RepID=A0A2C6JZR7_9APIC|nr:protein phosphatase 2c domain-containing [Cystoisospora suis]